jgi:flagellar biosynthetic protein FliR
MTATLLAVFARAIGFFARAPGLSRAGVPAAVRALFAFALALGVAPAHAARADSNAAAFVALIAGEALVGAVLGIVATLVAEAVAAAGRMLDDLAGLRASVPGLAIGPAGFGGLWSLVFVSAFFGLGGIEALVAAFAHSFDVVPLGAVLHAEMLRRIGFGFGAAFARLALELAAPAICVAACIHVGLAALARVLPRFGGLSLAFPAAYAGVLIVAFLSLGLVRELATAAGVRDLR